MPDNLAIHIVVGSGDAFGLVDDDHLDPADVYRLSAGWLDLMDRKRTFYGR
jgi:hypothetical protein